MKRTIKFLYKGKSYTVEAERDGSLLSIERDGESYEVTLLEEKAARPKVAKAAPVAAPVVTPKPAPAAAPAAVSASPGDLTAPMTGTVKELKVSQGEAVTGGQLVMVMEAMKMDIEVFSDRAGAVTAIHVAPGENVREKQPLMRIG